MPNLDSVTDPLSFAKKMWGGMGFSLPNLVTPTGQTGTQVAGSGNEALRQAALWPLTMLQQMQEQMQKAAAAAAQVSQAREDPPKA
jgi:hypothetical protein